MKLTTKQLRRIVNEEIGNAAAEEEPCPKPSCDGMLTGSRGMQVCDVCGWKKGQKKNRLSEETPPEDVERELSGAQSVLHSDQSSVAGKKLGSAMIGLLGKHTDQLKSLLGKGTDAKAVAKAAAQYIASKLPDVLALASEGKKRRKLVERNMSYVRFENTCRDLDDCLDHMEDGDLSEAMHRGRLIATCRDIVDEFEGHDFDDHDEDFDAANEIGTDDEGRP
jgi:hypothetical protein